MQDKINVHESVELNGEALTLLARIPVFGQSQLTVAIQNAVNGGTGEEFDQFQVRGKVGGVETTLTSSFGSIADPILFVSGNLAVVAAGAVAHLGVNCKGFDEISFWAACAAAVAAAGTLTAAENPTGGAFGTETLTASDVIVGGVASSGVLTGTTIADGDTVTIDGVAYTFVDEIVLPAPPNQVLVGATDSDSLDNLIAAINGGAGKGQVYSWLTEAHATVVAAAGSGDTMDVAARTRGEAGDEITTVAVLTAGDFGAETLAGGVDAETVTIGAITYTVDAAPLIDEPYHVLVGADQDETLDNLEVAINGDTGEGMVYGTGTEAHPQVSAANQGDNTLDITTLTQDASVIATTETCGDAAWGNTTVQGGVAPDTVTIGSVTYLFDATTLVDEPNHVLVGISADATLDNLEAAITYGGGVGTGEGTTFGTGTVAHPDADGANQGDDTLDLTALTAGKAGNEIATTVDAAADLSFGADTLEGGSGPSTVDIYVESDFPPAA